jgi:predicted acylesterase/phospholipase RssA/CRP-like cAMP-binding protein
MGGGGGDRARQLGRSGLFGDVDPGFLERLAYEVEWVDLPAGTTLFEEGDEADSLYVIVRGRIRLSAGGRTIAELGRDEPLGELGLLAAQPRSATARAVRDTELARLDRPSFEKLLREEPATLAWLTRRVAERVAPNRQTHHHARTARSVVVLGAVQRSVRDQVVDGLAEALRQFGPAVVVRERPAALAEMVDTHETSGTTVLLVPDNEWAEAAIGQADRILVLVDASARPALDGDLALLNSLGLGVDRAALELVLLQPRARSTPIGTPAWLSLRPFASHHHLHGDLRAADLQRLARHLAGRSIGLVLGGGGAKALAEIGAYRALCETGVPIDRVGGSSIGAVIAAQVAMGLDPLEMARVDAREFQKLRLDRRVTLPTISLLSARAAAAMFERMFGATQLEDLWLPTFVTTVDLSRGVLAIRSHGRVSTWVRASATPPAIWPAVADADGSLHVDGAVLDNLPVSTMRASGADRVIAIDVSATDDFRVAPDAPEVASALTPWRHPSGDAQKYPSLLKVLNRTAQVTSLGARQLARDDADIVIAPTVSDVGLTEYSTADRVIAAGYAEASAVLRGAAAEIDTWF